MKKADNKNKLFDFSRFSKSEAEVLKVSTQALKQRSQGGSTTTTKPLIIFTPNPEQLVQAYHDVSFGEVLGQADVLLPDGIGVIWASRLLAMRGLAPMLGKRITGVGIATELLRVVVSLDKKVLVVGGREYDASLNRLREVHPSIWSQVTWKEGYRIVGHPTDDEETALCGYIRRQKPNVVFVAFGAPYQEQWVVKHRALLSESGVEIVMVVGGAFDVMLEKVARAPLWIQTLGLEWLFRLIQQPWRWRRQLRLIEFLGLVARKMVDRA